MTMKDLVAALRMAESNYYVDGRDLCLVAAEHIEALVKKANQWRKDQDDEAVS